MVDGSYLVAKAANFMTGHEIAELTRKRHDQVLRTARALLNQGAPQSVECWYHAIDDGRSYQRHLLSKRDSLVLVARLSPEFTGRVVDRRPELAAATAVSAPTMSAGALRLTAEQVEQIEAQAAQLTAAKAALEFVGKYVDAPGLLGFRQVCKLLGANENRFGEFLLDRAIWSRLGGEWRPHSQHLNAGRFVVKACVSVNGHAFIIAGFTAKGVQWVVSEFVMHPLTTLQTGGVANGGYP